MFYSATEDRNDTWDDSGDTISRSRIIVCFCSMFPPSKEKEKDYDQEMPQ